MQDYTPEELLDAREKRVGLIHELLKQYKTPLLAIRVNYPGLKKTNNLTQAMIDDISPIICGTLKPNIRGRLRTQGAEGPILYLAVEEDLRALKRLAIEFEEKHSLGRCLDLDVYDNRGIGTVSAGAGMSTGMSAGMSTGLITSLSREELGYPRRKCYLCEDDAQHCVRARRHSEGEVIEFIEKRYREWREEQHR